MTGQQLSDPGDIPLVPDVGDGYYDEPEPASVLDRPINLDFVSWLTAGWIIVALAAILLRVVNLTAWPLSAREAGLASNALSIVQGGSIPAAAHAAPLQTELTALLLFLFGNSDGIIRLVPLLAGLGSLALISWLRPFGGRGFVLAATAVVAISPTLVAASRFAESGGLLTFSSLLAFGAGLRWLEDQSTGYGILFGVAAAMMVMSAPVGWIALPIVAISMALVSDERNAPARDLLLVLLSAAVTILVVSTTIFVHPTGFADFFRESFRGLWNQHLANAGQQWHLATFELLIDETLSLALVVAAIVYYVQKRDRDRSRLFTSGLLLWTALAFLFATLLGGKDNTLFAFMALPLALLAGDGLRALVQHIRWSEYTFARGLLFIVLLPITFFAGVSTYGLLTSDVGSDSFAWFFRFLLVAIIVFAPLLALIIWLRSSLNGWAAVVGLFVVLLLSVVAIRGSALLSDTINSRPGELLITGVSEPAVGITVDQIRAVSADMTTFQQDVRDPTGGHGLSIGIDSSITEPFRWYFRDFPNVTLIDPSQPITAEQAPQVFIVRSDHAGILPTNDNRLARTLPLESTMPRALSNPSFGSLLRAIFHPGEWQKYPEFLVNRQLTQPAEPTHFTLSLGQDVVLQMYGGNPPANP